MLPLPTQPPPPLPPSATTLETSLAAVFEIFERSESNATIDALTRVYKVDDYLKGLLHVAKQKRDPYQQINNSPVPSIEEVTDAIIQFLLGDVRAVIATLSKSPNVQASRTDAGDETAVEPSILANRLIAILRLQLPMKEIVREIVKTFCVRGTAFVCAKLKRLPDGSKTELRPQTNDVLEITCSGCGAGYVIPPQDSGTCPGCQKPTDQTDAIVPTTRETMVPTNIPIARFAPKISVHNISEVSATPSDNAQEFAQTPWLIQDEEEFLGDLYEQYPQLHELFPEPTSVPRTTSHASAIKRVVRMRLASPLATRHTESQIKATCSYRRLRPQGYIFIQDKSVRSYLQATYPKGLEAVFVGQRLVKISEYQISKYWRATAPDVQKTISAEPYFFTYLGKMDIINSSAKILTRAAAGAIPHMIYDPTHFSNVMVEKLQTTVGGYFPVTAPLGHGGAALTPVGGVKFPSAHLPFMDSVLSSGRDESGAKPEIWGGSQAATAEQARINSHGAMQRLSTPWDRTSELIGHATTALIDQIIEAAKQGPVELFADPTSPAGIDVTWAAALAIEAFRISPGEGDGVPQTAGQRRDWFNQLFIQAGSNPAFASLFSLEEPENVSAFLESMGSTQFKVPQLEQSNRIEAMLEAVMSIQDPAILENYLQLQVSSQPPPAPGVPPPPVPALVPGYDMEIWGKVLDPALVLNRTRAFIVKTGPEAIPEMSPSAQNLTIWIRYWMALAAPPPPPVEDVDNSAPTGE